MTEKILAAFGLLTLVTVLTSAPTTTCADQPSESAVRMVVTKSTDSITIDGDLSEFNSAVGTPVEYFHPDQLNRAAQFVYLWDDDAFYVGLRTLDQKTHSPLKPLWEGDAVEWYFDTRRDDTFLNSDWKGKGALHCFWTAMEEDELKPRFCLRPGYEDAIPKTGIEYAAKRTSSGLTVEFKLPWVNFPDFKPAVGAIIGMDAELSYSDGEGRSDRSFVFGSPVSVMQPANLAQVRLTDKFHRDDWAAAGPVMMPIRIDTPWGQKTEPHAFGKIAMPVNHAEQIGRVDFRLTDLNGNVLGTYPAEKDPEFHAEGKFDRRVAKWPKKSVQPGRYQVTAIVYDKDGNELTRIAPRMVSVNMKQGY